MRSSWFLSCLLLLLLNEVASEDQTVDCAEGDSVILPCGYNGPVPKREEVTVIWRNHNGQQVYTIDKGEVKAADPEYENRTQSFPDSYERGNFSIKLSRVRRSDEGSYSCFLKFTDEANTVQLQVKDPAPAPGPSPKPRNKAQESRSAEVLMIFTVLLGFTLVQV